MVPPPAASSPRRFITKKTENPTPKPPSNLRFQAGAPPPNTPQTSSRPASAHQFAATPKFSFAQPKRHEALPISPPKPKTPAAVYNVWERMPTGEVIEDASQEDNHGEQGEEDDNDDDGDDEMILETTEFAQQEHDDWPPSPKRQRLEESRDSHAESEHTTRPSFAMPSTIPAPSPLHVNHPTPRRFVLAPAVPSPFAIPHTTRSDDPQQQFSRPTFVKPLPVPAESAEPLPEAFSPHKRGQKFLPGGMASEVRQWIVDVSQAATHSHSRRPNGDIFHVRVAESRGNAKEGMILVIGSVEGKDVQLILPGASKKTATPVKPGEFLGVKAPTWEVEIQGGTWVVAADWRLLKD